MKIKHISILALALVLLLPAVTPMFAENGLTATTEDATSGPLEIIEPAATGYTNHGPITIIDDANFTDYGFPGNGSQSNPYIIEGYNITTDGDCIYIENVQSHFEIRGNLLASATTKAGWGVRIVTTGNHSLVYNNTVVDKNRGIGAMEAPVDIINNTVDSPNSGIYCFRPEGIVENNTVSNIPGGYGIRVWQGNDITVRNNTVTDVMSVHGGLSLYYSTDINVVENTFVRSGIELTLTTVEAHARHNFTDNVINGLPLAYLWNTSGTDLDVNGYGQVIVANSTDITLRNGAINETISGIQIWNSENITGVDLVFGNNDQAVSVHYSENILVTNSTFENNNRGVKLASSISSNVSGSTFTGSLGYSIETSSSTQESLFKNNSFYGASIGILLAHDNMSVINNRFFDCDYSIRGFNSKNVTVRGNYVTGTTFSAMYLYNTVNYTIIQNEVINNNQKGIELSGASSEDNRVYHNYIGWNTPNAYDTGTNNVWDDDVNVGNYWHDYSGSGTYSISGTAGAIDRYPSIIRPIVSAPANISYEEGMTGNNITWGALSYDPDQYTVLRNGTSVADSSWAGEDITVSTDGLSAGLYNFTVTVLNSAGAKSNDTVWVHVIASSAPHIDSPSDRSFAEGTLCLHLTWTANDDFPATYTVFKNSTVFDSGVWNSSEIRISLDGLVVGEYNFTTLVTDEAGNKAADSVIVTVLDETSPTTSSPADEVIEYGMTDVSVSWELQDGHPVGYEVFHNGTSVQSGEWSVTGEIITISLEGFGLGVHNLTIVATDIGGNTAADTVFVTVVDSENPTIDSPQDVSVAENATGVTVAWNASDDTPESYSIYKDGELFREGEWNSSEESISVLLDGFAVGEYNLTIVVEDAAGNTVSDTVIVIITEVTDTTTTATTTTSTTTETTPGIGDPLSSLGLVAAVVGAVIGIVIIVLVIRKRS
ncbi:MAG: hypothetical protein GF309_08055 [Candidatus Lokiarchaeota archaeon]|nr:hypothetical protein [Candidatus Lokiarchaeota archaeon]